MTRNFRRAVLSLCVIIASAFAAHAQFTAGNLVVLQVGDGSGALTNAATPLILKEFTPAGAPATVLPLPTSGATALTASGSATSEGNISRSADGGSIIIPGYNANAGTAAVVSTSSGTVARAIGRVTAAGVYSLPVISNTAFNANNIRGAASDGAGNYWAVGASTGVCYFGTGTPATVYSAVTNIRTVQIFQGNLLFSTGSGASRGVYATIGTPTTTSFFANILTVTGSNSPYNFAFSPDNTVCYVADDANFTATGNQAGGIQKYMFNGSAWVFQYTLQCGATTTGARGLTVDFSGTNPVVYATTTEAAANRLIRIVDTGASSGSGATLVATAPANTAFRGVVFSPASACVPPAITNVTANSPVCAGSTLNLGVTATGDAPLNYGWAGPNGFLSSVQNPSITNVTALEAGTYTVVVTNGCGNTNQTVNVVLNPSPGGTTVVTNVACFGGNTGAIDLTPTGGTSPYTFNWLPSGPTTEDRTGLIAGTYSVQITDANGCNGTVTATVTQPTSPVSGITVVTNVACFGGNTGAINLTPTGGVGPYTFNWLPSGPTTEDRTGLLAGTYSVQITDANSCNGTVTATVTEPTSPVSGTTVVTNVACFGGNTGAINLTPTGGTGPYTFNWLPSGPTTEDRTGLVTGTYSVQITDANGCNGTVTATVTQPTSPVSGTTLVTNVACFGGNTGAINLTPTGGTGPYTFNWLPSGPTTEDRTGLVAGTYSVQITDVNGCNGTVTATVTEPTSPVSGTTVVTNVACFGGNTGAINLTPTGGVGPYTFNWLPSGPTTEDRTGLVAGTYSVQITDVNGCNGTVTATVTEPTSPVSGTTVVTNVACFGGNTGAIDLTPTGGVGPYTFNWLPSGPTTEDRTGLITGTYSVQITDANGCNGTVTATVTQPASQVNGTTLVTNVACFGGNTGAINLTPTGGTGPYTFNWLPSGPTTEDRTGLIAGTYSVQITDVNGCNGTVTATVTEPASPVSGTTVVTNVACFGGNTGAINLTPTGGTGPYTFNWLPAGPTTEDRTGLVAGTYSVQITDANGCQGTVTATVTQAGTPISGTTVVTNVSCFGGSNGAIDLTPSGGTPGYTYFWLPSGPTTEDRSGLAASVYSVTITDANGCTGTVTATVTEPTAPVSGTTVVTNVSCFGGSNGAINLTPAGGTGPYTFLWLPSGPTTEDRTGLAVGSYSVEITDANGCTGTVTAGVTEPAQLTAVMSAAVNPTCFGGNNGSATVTASGGTPGYTYLWSPAGGTGSAATGLSATAYTVIITDANGCTVTESVTLTEPSVLISSTSSTDVTCNGANDGTATVSVSGGTPGYTYLWMPGNQTNGTATGLAPGSYTATITDANGCTSTASVSLTEPAQLTVATADAHPTTCGGTDGSIDLTPSGGTAPYTFAWSSSDVTEDISGLAAGTYTVTITDDNGCTVTSSSTLNDPAAPTVTYSEPVDTACAGTLPTPPFVLTPGTPAGGTWSGPGVSANQFDAAAANLGYNVITYLYTDAVTGCSATAMDSIWVDICTNVADPVADNSFSLYPNPNDGHFTLSFASEEPLAAMEIFNAQGQLIEGKTVRTGENIDLSGYAKGIYIVRINGASQRLIIE